MKTARAALLGAAILLCCLSGVYSRLSFEEQPQDEVIIRLGEEDILTCVVNDDGVQPTSLVKWVVIIDEADKDIYPGNPPFERYTYVDENHNGGNYNLRIANASPEDNAAFRCVLDHGSTEEEYEYSNTAKVFVAVPPTLYYFMQNDTELEGNMAAVFVTTEPGSLTLFVADGNPAPVEVTWYRASADAEQLIPLYNVVTDSYENVEQHFFNTTSTVTVPQNGLNDEDIVRVEIAHPALDEAFVVNITADVQYGPSELIITPPSPAELDEGEPAEVVCESDGNPQTTITWKKNQQVIAEGASLTFDLVQSSDAGNDYSCVAQNKYGVKSRQYQINVGATVSGAMIAGIIIAILAVFMVAAIVGYMYVNKMSCFAPAAKPIQPTTTAPAFETQASHPVKDEAWAAGTGQAYENKVEKDDEGFHTIDLDKAASETADPKALDDNTPSRSRESYAAAMSKPQPMPTPSATIAEDEMGESV